MFTIIRGGRYGVGVVRRCVQGGNGHRVGAGGGVAQVENKAPREGARVLRAWINGVEHVGRIVARAVARLFGETGTVSW